MKDTTRTGPARLVCGPRSKWIVIVLWIAVLAVAFPLGTKLNGAQQNDNAAWLPGKAESTQVLDIAKKFTPETAPAEVLYHRPGGLNPADLRAITRDAAEIRRMTAHGLLGSRATGPVLDREQQPRAARTIVPISIDAAGWEGIAEAVDLLRTTAERGSPQGLTVHLTGPGGYTADQADAFAGIDGTLLYSALGVVVVLLLLTYRSPTLLLLPILTVVGALFSAQALVYLLATRADLVVNGQSAGILTVLVFGAGTDYALLLVARYREELRRHEDRHEAMALALHRAGPAIVASSATVALSMLCLMLAEMNSTSGLGPVAAIGVGVAVLAMLTLFPALLVACGRWVFWPRVPHLGSPEPTRTGVWSRLGGRMSKRPRAVWVAAALALGAMAVGLTSLKADGLSLADSFTGTPDSVVGQRVSDRYFPAGANQPLVFTARSGATEQVRKTVAADPGIVPESVAVPRGFPAERAGHVYLQATLTDPPDGERAHRTVDRLRAAVHKLPDAEAKVGGGSAIQLDVNRATGRDNQLIIPVVLVVVFLILGLLLRAVLAPLLLIATVVLSFAAALGVSALAFRHLFDFAGEETAFPLFVFVFLVALGIDYNIFLITRVREEAAKHGTRRGTLAGLAATGGVITSAGLVLAGTFAVLGTLPVTAFAEMGAAVAFGIVLDTFVVRSVLVCALLLDIGGRAWWPNRVDPSANGAEATGTAAGDGPSGPAAGADDEDGERGQP